MVGTVLLVMNSFAVPRHELLERNLELRRRRRATLILRPPVAGRRIPESALKEFVGEGSSSSPDEFVHSSEEAGSENAVDSVDDSEFSRAYSRDALSACVIVSGGKYDSRVEKRKLG